MPRQSNACGDSCRICARRFMRGGRQAQSARRSKPHAPARHTSRRVSENNPCKKSSSTSEPDVYRGESLRKLEVSGPTIVLTQRRSDAELHDGNPLDLQLTELRRHRGGAPRVQLPRTVAWRAGTRNSDTSPSSCDKLKSVDIYLQNTSARSKCTRRLHKLFCILKVHPGRSARANLQRIRKQGLRGKFGARSRTAHAQWAIAVARRGHGEQIIGVA
jgi:hypothetical protein